MWWLSILPTFVGDAAAFDPSAMDPALVNSRMQSLDEIERLRDIAESEGTTEYGFLFNGRDSQSFKNIEIIFLNFVNQVVARVCEFYVDVRPACAPGSRDQA